MKPQRVEPAIFSRYLALLGVEPKPPSYTNLEELVAAHLTRIPFENISKLYYLRLSGTRNIPEFSQYLDGIEHYHFGGTCYSNNRYLHELLSHLGYSARLCGADMTNPDVHLVNMVSVDCREYLVDVGYAAPFIKPMPLDAAEDQEVRLGRDRYVLRPRDEEGCSCIEHYRDGRMLHGYRAKPARRQIEYFSPAIIESFQSEATFMNSLLLVKFGKRWSLTIHNLSVIESEGADTKVTLLPLKAELPAVIEEHFGIPTEVTAEAISGLGDLRSAQG